MNPAVPAYLPSPSPASRACVVSAIAAAHALALLALVSIGGVAVIVERAPMLVSFLPEPAAPSPAIPARSVPLPQLQRPEIRIPEPPRVEIIQQVQVVERPAPPAPPVPEVQPAAEPSPAPVATAPAPAPLEPPRFDLAYLNNPPPAYPVFAKRAREEGVVMLRVRVDAKGEVAGIEIQRSSGSERLDKAALAAVRHWRFVPARQGNRDVAGVALVPIHFELS